MILLRKIQKRKIHI